MDIILTLTNKYTFGKFILYYVPHSRKKELFYTKNIPGNIIITKMIIYNI